MQKLEALQIFGLSASATLSQIKAAYRIEAKKVHPDVGGTADMFDRVTTAYDVLMTALVENSETLLHNFSEAPNSSSADMTTPDLSALGPASDPLIPTDHVAITRLKL